MVSWLSVGILAILAAAGAETSLRCEVDRTTIRLSETVVLTLTVEGRAPLEVKLEERLIPSEAWRVRSAGPAVIEPLPGARQRWRQRFVLSPVQPGALALPLLPVRYRAGEPEKVGELTHAAIPVEVKTEITNVDLSELRDITDIAQVPAPPPSMTWRPVLVGVAVVLLGLLIARRLLRRRPPPPMELAADEWALQELDGIETLGLPAQGEIERYHTLVSDVLRGYLERRFGLRAPEQTTPEFLEGLRHSSRLPADQQEQLRDFLERCDLAKFARADFSAEDCRQNGRLARDFVQQTGLQDGQHAN